MRKTLYVAISASFLIVFGMVSYGPTNVLAAIGFTPVRDVTNPALQPFAQALTISTPADRLGGGASFTVPAGKRLVIEYASFNIRFPANQDVTFAWVAVETVGANQFPINHYLHANFQAVTTGAGGAEWVWVANSPVRLYADPGSVVEVAVRRNVVGGTGLASVSISGHLVNLP